MGMEDAGYGIIRPHDDDYFDAMIIAQTGVMLCVHTADCVPVVLLDPVKRVVGIVLTNRSTYLVLVYVRLS